MTTSLTPTIIMLKSCTITLFPFSFDANANAELRKAPGEHDNLSYMRTQTEESLDMFTQSLKSEIRWAHRQLAHTLAWQVLGRTALTALNGKQHGFR